MSETYYDGRLENLRGQSRRDKIEELKLRAIEGNNSLAGKFEQLQAENKRLKESLCFFYKDAIKRTKTPKLEYASNSWWADEMIKASQALQEKP